MKADRRAGKYADRQVGGQADRQTGPNVTALGWGSVRGWG